jgi:hypothetical protein
MKNEINKCKIKSEALFYLQVIINAFVILILLNVEIHAQKVEELFDWSITTSKQAFYPGEPVLLTFNITNQGAKEEIIDFGSDGIEAFSMEIFDSNNNNLFKSTKIKRGGASMKSRTITASPGQTAQKSIVLNQWCSTLLAPGKYHIICNIEYRLRSEYIKIDEKNNGYKAGPIHIKKLEIEIEIIKMDITKFKQIMEDLYSHEAMKETQTRSQWISDLEIPHEMIAFTESDLAVPYQIKVLQNDLYPWLRIDLVNSLARSGTLEAAIGLMKIFTDPSVLIMDIKQDFINAVYKLRETGNAEIINATDDFVTKYKKRPIPLRAD